MRKLITIFLSIVALCSNADSLAIGMPKSLEQKEYLQYNIYYHKGFIWLKAGRGSLTLNEEKMADGSTLMHGILQGRSLNIVETFFTVRDTIDTWFTPEYIPIEYRKATNEGSYKAIETMKYKTFFKGQEKTISNVDSTLVDIVKERKKYGTDSAQMRQDGIAYDMFSILYHVRSLDYENMKLDKVMRFPIFDGTNRKVVKMTFKGQTETKLRGGGMVTGFQVDLAFDVEGEDGVPMNVWLSTDKAHVPLNIVIHLKRIGSIQCEIAQEEK